MKACIAFAHITIPTLEDYEKQNRLFLLAAQCSLLNGLVGETDSLMKAILSTMDSKFTKQAARLTSLGQKIETSYTSEMYRMGETLQSMLGFLVLVPSNPEGSYF